MDFNSLMDNQENPVNNEPDFSQLAVPKKRGPKPGKLKKKVNVSDQDNLNNIYIYKDRDIDTDYNVGIVKDNSNIDTLNYKKGIFTKQELAFLEMFFNSRHLRKEDKDNIDKLMISAGFVDFSERYRYILARKIIQRYEQSGPDPREVFEKLGFGHVRQAQACINHVEDSPPMVSLNALKLAMQATKLIDAPETGNQGITINICTAPPPVVPGSSGPAAPVVDVQTFGPAASAASAAPGPARKPLQITR